ncbi:hypothetical protein TUM19329_21360 [Legionella antarctica]|uniref:Uncharacterized protein n=1 Tax=Legionella antarctica TaxID=2708020 RepID=A0A6F8T509_9GAMM|nr:hypothetical protein [Legionella antarctica]BCA95775.1 hypothetical protein TUM19329_21360 [Legionella antarctica]
MTLAFITQSFALDGPLSLLNANKDLLPSPYPVYVINNSAVVNQPYPGAVKVLLPTDNSYTEAPGCYIACYSHKTGVYSVSPSISVMGQIRVKGQYISRVCQPDGYQGKDISAEPMFKLLCAKTIPNCDDEGCWGGGDTGGWFGIQP